MKRLIAAIIIIALVTAISVFGFLDLKTAVNEIIFSLNQCEESYLQNNNELTIQYFQQANEKWKKVKPRLMIYCNHGSLEDIDKNFRILEKSAQEEPSDEFMELCKENTVLAEKLIDSEKPKLENIL